MKKPKSSSGRRIRILIADDHPIVREGLEGIIAAQPDMVVVAQAENGREAVERFVRYHPDVVLVDLRMPEMNGIEVIRAILAKDEKANIVVLSTYGGDEDIYRAFQAGAKAYLLKDADEKTLLSCIRTVQSGRQWLSPDIGEKLVARLRMRPLTRREVEIARLMADGKSNKDIGNSLGISESTVKVHIGHIFEKLGADGRAHAIRVVLERGLAHLGNYFEI
jgi:two-component system NarL family response regulator